MKNSSLFFAYADEYLHTYIPKQREMSKQTEKTYTDALSLFRRYAFECHKLAVDKLAFGHINFDFITGFTMWLKDSDAGKSGSSAQTCNLRVSAIRSYIKFAMSKDAGLTSLWILLKGIPPVKTVKAAKDVLSEDALRAMIECAYKQNRLGLRNATLLVLMYDSACRISEILELKMCDVFLDTTDPYIFVMGKGRKERRLPLMERTALYLKEYAAAFHGDGLDAQYLFYSIIKGTTGPLSQDCISKILKKTADEVRVKCPDITDFPDKIHAHMFRRSRATHLYQAGYDIYWIARFLGHELIETTKEYLNPSMEQMRRALEASSSADDFKTTVNTDEYEKKRARLYGIR